MMDRGRQFLLKEKIFLFYFILFWTTLQSEICYWWAFISQRHIICYNPKKEIIISSGCKPSYSKTIWTMFYSCNIYINEFDHNCSLFDTKLFLIAITIIKLIFMKAMNFNIHRLFHGPLMNVIVFNYWSGSWRNVLLYNINQLYCDCLTYYIDMHFSNVNIFRV